MSQIEQNFRTFLSRNPELEICYQKGLINRRSFARYLIKQGIADNNQLEAVIAMIRRFPFNDMIKNKKNSFLSFKINVKDKIVILDFQKEKELVKKLRILIENTNYDRGDTLKIVVSSRSVKIFLDEENEKKVRELLKEFKLKNRLHDISEINLMFSDDAITEKGILSTITRELTINDIIISESLTASPELLIYLEEKYMLKAYDIFKRLQK